MPMMRASLATATITTIAIRSIWARENAVSRRVFRFEIRKMCHYADNQFYSVEKSVLVAVNLSCTSNKYTVYCDASFKNRRMKSGAKKSKISSGFCATDDYNEIN